MWRKVKNEKLEESVSKELKWEKITIRNKDYNNHSHYEWRTFDHMKSKTKAQRTMKAQRRAENDLPSGRSYHLRLHAT